MPLMITIPAPHVPFGPTGVREAEADAHYMRSAARNLRHARGNGRSPFGLNLTDTVEGLLISVAGALEAQAETTVAEADLEVGRYHDGTYEWDYEGDDGWTPVRAPSGMPARPALTTLSRVVTTRVPITVIPTPAPVKAPTNRTRYALTTNQAVS